MIGVCCWCADYSTDHFYFKPGVVPNELVAILPKLATPEQAEAFQTQYSVEGQGFFFEFWCAPGRAVVGVDIF